MISGSDSGDAVEAETSSGPVAADHKPNGAGVVRAANVVMLPPPVKGRGWVKAIALLFVLIAITGAAFYVVNARHYESTDDAFVEGRVIPVAAKVAGYVVALHVEDNQHVTAGDVLAEIDPRDYEAALTEAKANLLASQSRFTDAGAKKTVLDAQVAMHSTHPAGANGQAQIAVMVSWKVML